MTLLDFTAPFGHYSPATVTPDGTIWVSAQLPMGSGISAHSPVPRQTRAVDAVFAEVFGERRPARTVLQVGGLHHGFRVAADAVSWRTP
ncbi:RidA family protein [Nonomuraea sp. NEAU-A123]|uniref:RidA family protein n=1 Tax=Nonomuraea sp. NEAU-A123 TaxID=2839649 RepID=UPI001BE47DF5|nr:RidA family protein [Nonomuraea sp. NEAU-A123]MBT2229891.1 RidA family protein [Nonomuraea sp. NEAU-A123]